MKALVAEMKNVPCMDCGDEFPHVCMEFDHRHPEEKFKAVANLVGTGYRWSVVLEEIAKCDVVCSNCHAVRTHGHLLAKS